MYLWGRVRVRYVIIRIAVKLIMYLKDKVLYKVRVKISNVLSPTY